MEPNPKLRTALRIVAAIVVIAIALRVYSAMPPSPFLVRPGMTREEVREVAGKPYYSEENTWLYRGNHWYSDPRAVYFGPNGKVESIE